MTYTNHFEFLFWLLYHLSKYSEKRNRGKDKNKKQNNIQVNSMPRETFTVTWNVNHLYLLAIFCDDVRQITRDLVFYKNSSFAECILGSIVRRICYKLNPTTSLQNSAIYSTQAPSLKIHVTENRYVSCV